MFARRETSFGRPSCSRGSGAFARNTFRAPLPRMMQL
jgi:hypothetical protein